MTKGKNQYGLEGALLGGVEQRITLLDNMKMYYSIIHEPRHQVVDPEIMHSVFSKFYKEMRDYVNHRQFDELYKFVKDNSSIDVEVLEQKYRTLYLAGNK